MPFQTHASQSVVEFREMVRRHGKTPIEFMADLGLLGPRTTVAHAIFLDHHPWLSWPNRRDLSLLGESGANVAHAPNIFARRAMLLKHVGAYRKAGVNLGLGTDSFPHNMIDEMRWATIMAKVASGDVHGTSVGEIFEVATVGGARALGRDDIGRVARGAKADLALIDLDHPSMQPVRDPLRSLVFSALERPVRDVYVDGRLVVQDGEVLTLDHRAAGERLNDAQVRGLAGVSERDWGKRSVDEIFPLSLELREAIA
jgi:cytosine/adenosine deaminase-related metal-dependent hydrolase